MRLVVAVIMFVVVVDFKIYVPAIIVVRQLKSCLSEIKLREKKWFAVSERLFGCLMLRLLVVLFFGCYCFFIIFLMKITFFYYVFINTKEK